MSMPLKYDMPGAITLDGSGDQIISLAPTFPIMILIDADGNFADDLIGRDFTIAGASNPGNNGTFTVTNTSGTQVTMINAASVSEDPFNGTWSVDYVPRGTILSYDAAEIEDDALMLSGPHTEAGGSVPPVSWPNPGPDDQWDGPYGPELVAWDNTSHPGADMTQGGWSPPNKALKYDTDIPAGWYTRTSTKNRYNRREPEIPFITEPVEGGG